MNKNIKKYALCVIMGSTLGLVSCNKEIDESNLYTFTGQTIEDYLQSNDSIFSQFNVIMKRSGYDRVMATYGEYTCYAPKNEGVIRYVDSLYNDETAKIPHNGMTENSVEGLTDEQCKEIALYHLSASKNSYVEALSLATENKEVTTMLGIPFYTKLCEDGIVRFNNIAAVQDFDLEMTNGYIHILDNVIPHTTKTLNEIFEDLKTKKIFFEALEKCGLLDTLLVTKKEGTYSVANRNGRPGSGMASSIYYYPTQCKIAYTIFAEDDETFAKEGITDFPSLKAKCIEWYKDAKDWYKFPGYKETEISVSNDYTNTYNVVNMFVRYHIIKAGMPVSKLVFERDLSNQAWNFAYGGEPFEYYETMLPHALMKIWQPLYQNTPGVPVTTIWINRWRQNNTLTDEIGTYGKDETHQIKQNGCKIDRAKSDVRAYNGYIHTIDTVLLYDKTVNDCVLHERMRFDTGSMLYELINNNIRFATGTQIGEMNTDTHDGTMVRLPLDYFDNLISYNTKTQLSWYIQGAWRAWNCDQLSGWGENDFAIKLPSVPTGDYEIRIIYPPMANGGLQQYYLGTSSNPSSMQPLGLPFDARYPNSTIEEDRAATGYMLSNEFDDYGVASDLVMRNHGYMRAPASFSRGNSDGKGPSTPIYIRSTPDVIMESPLINCCRYEEGYGTSMMRKILGNAHMEQDKNYYLRLKNLLTGYDQLGFSIDFIELVPLDIVNNMSYTEDWY